MNRQRKVTTRSGLIISYSPVKAEKIITAAEASEKGLINPKPQVELRQEVTTTYPKARANGLFTSSELAGEEAVPQSYTEKRVTWLRIPDGVAELEAAETGAGIEAIEERLRGMDQPTLYRVLDCIPVLSEEQKRTIDNGTNPKSYEDYLKDNILDREGREVLFAGEKQYRKIFFSKSVTADEDHRAQTLSARKSKAIQIAEAPGKTVNVRTQLNMD